ncbi:MAG: formylglycine-generating enzyme family protein [Bacteroidales bacterium]|nr:formylglycine-generating enzyme family protein [Bacteroidales bacterium]
MCKPIFQAVFICSLLALFSCSGNPEANNQDSSKVQDTVQVSGPKELPAAEMISFPGGTFSMGSNDGLPQEKPAHQVTVKPFRIDKHPVTVKEFRKFVKATGYKTDADNFGNSGVFSFETYGWELKNGVNWEYPLGRTNPVAEDNHLLRMLAGEMPKLTPAGPESACQPKPNGNMQLAAVEKPI